MILFDKPITKQDLYVYVHVPSTAEAARASTSWGKGSGAISEGHIVCNYTKTIAPLMNS